MQDERISRDPQQAFTEAINAGRLSINPKAGNYAGKYMFMGVSPRTGNDLFKHIDTRRYLPDEAIPAIAKDLMNLDLLEEV